MATRARPERWTLQTMRKPKNSCVTKIVGMQVVCSCGYKSEVFTKRIDADDAWDAHKDFPPVR